PRVLAPPLSLRSSLLTLFSVLFLFFVRGTLDAQEPTGVLTGIVTEPSGAAVAKTAVRLVTASGASLDTTSNEEGFYEFTGLAPGSYTLKAAAKGFTLFTKENVQILVG